MAFQGDSIYWVEVEKVVPNPFQPRREFDQNKLQELADSIRMYGVLQPLTVTRNEVQQNNGTFYTEYELIAGERRLRASKLAGTAQVPVIIREGEQNEQEKLELAIIENLQREDLNAVDRSIAFKQLAEAFGLSHVQVAKKVGRSREYVSNSIRLLGLPEHILDSLRLGKMMEGHARTLLMLTDRPEQQEVVYKEILLKKLSVREVERIVRKIATDKVRKKNPGEFDPNLIEFEKKFTETLGTRVQIQKTDFGGKLTIDYFSEDDLAIILKRMQDEALEKITSPQAMMEKLAQNTPLTATKKPESVASATAETAMPDEPSVSDVVKKVLHSPITQNAEIAEQVEETPAPEVVPQYAEATVEPDKPAPVEVPKLEENQPASNSAFAPAHASVSAGAYNSAPSVPNVSEPTPTPVNLPTQISDSVSPLAVQNDVEIVAPPTADIDTAVQPSEIPAVSPDNSNELHPQAPKTEIPPLAQTLQPVPEPPKPDNVDESDLYSMRNFSV